MTYQACFRCDANSEIGSGHVMRCLAIANALRELGWACSFLSDTENNEIHPSLTNSGYEVLAPDSDVEYVDLLIVDHYGLDQSYEAPCRKWAQRIVVIDDLADRQHDCDVLVDTTFGRRKDEYLKLVPKNCVVLTGANYAFLRPQFSKMRNASLKRRMDDGFKVRNILISMGGTNLYNINEMILNSLNSLADVKYNINVVLGDAIKNLKDFDAIAKKSHHDIIYYKNVKNMSNLMLEADVSIGASGTTSWERCCMGLPALVVILADNQLRICQELEKVNAIKCCTDYKNLDMNSILTALSNLVDNPHELEFMSNNASQICDGMGIERFLKEVAL